MPVVQRLIDRSVQKMGGRASSRVVAILAAVLALDSADKGAIGAMAVQLESDLAIGKAQLGLLVTVSSLAGIVGILPFGWLVDRACRTRVLAITVLVWGAAMTASATSSNYTYLLIMRFGLGVIVAAAIPAVASLTGDFFPSHTRARIYGYILAGEFIGTGIGFIVSGELATISWRIGFIALALPTPLIAWLLFRMREPGRGGSDRLKPGQERVGDPASVDTSHIPEEDRTAPDQTGLIRDLIRRGGISPREQLVFDINPNDKSLLWAVWYVLSVPTNIVLIVASALGYYFMAGLRVFGVQYVHGWFHVPHTAAIGVVVLFGMCALAGAVTGGRFADLLLARRHLTARVAVAIYGYLAATIFLLPVFLTHVLPLAIPSVMLAGVTFGAINPPLDAARLDIMHPYLWGRAESIRTVLRLSAEAIAPFLFGYMAEDVFRGGVSGMRQTFLVMLIPVAASGAIALIGFRTYPRDVATAEAYARRTAESHSAAAIQPAVQ
jgi:MFS family permease